MGDVHVKALPQFNDPGLGSRIMQDAKTQYRLASQKTLAHPCHPVCHELAEVSTTEQRRITRKNQWERTMCVFGDKGVYPEK